MGTFKRPLALPALHHPLLDILVGLLRLRLCARHTFRPELYSRTRRHIPCAGILPAHNHFPVAPVADEPDWGGVDTLAGSRRIDLRKEGVLRWS